MHSMLSIIAILFLGAAPLFGLTLSEKKDDLCQELITARDPIKDLAKIVKEHSGCSQKAERCVPQYTRFSYLSSYGKRRLTQALKCNAKEEIDCDDMQRLSIKMDLLIKDLFRNELPATIYNNWYKEYSLYLNNYAEAVGCPTF